MRLQFRLLLETAFLTVLIWTYADQTSFETCDAIVAVRIATPPDVVARIEGARAGTADVIYIPMKLRGPKSAIRTLEMDRSSGATLFNLKVAIADDVEPRVSYTRDIRDDVARMPAIRDRGLQLTELSRQIMVFTLDRYVATKLTVEADAGKFAEALDGKPVIEPNTVTVKVLESELDKRSTSEQRLVIPIEEQIRKRAEDATATFQVPLGPKWGDIVDARFVPDQVRVTVRLARSYQTVDLSLIPLRVLWPPGMTGGDYEIEWQAPADLLQNISVRIPIGKPKALDSTDVDAFIKLEKSDFPAEASLATTTAPAPESWSQREVQFFFPGFGDVQVDGQRQVKFRIKKRPGTGSLAPLTDLP
jgi:hypothetical protein